MWNPINLFRRNKRPKKGKTLEFFSKSISEELPKFVALYYSLKARKVTATELKEGQKELKEIERYEKEIEELDKQIYDVRTKFLESLDLAVELFDLEDNEGNKITKENIDKIEDGLMIELINEFVNQMKFIKESASKP